MACQGAFTIAHVIVAMMWMGLLWFFNFVQTPAFAEMEAGSRNDALDKLTWRALWWFRWSAAATVVFGLLIIAIAPKGTFGKDFWIHSTAGPDPRDRHPVRPDDVPQRVARHLAAQQIVIANARTLKAGVLVTANGA